MRQQRRQRDHGFSTPRNPDRTPWQATTRQRRKVLLGTLEHFDRTLEPLDSRRRDVVEKNLGKKPLATVELEDDARPVNLGQQGRHDLNLVSTLGDKVTSAVQEDTGGLLAPTVLVSGFLPIHPRISFPSSPGRSERCIGNKCCAISRNRSIFITLPGLLEYFSASCVVLSLS